MSAGTMSATLRRARRRPPLFSLTGTAIAALLVVIPLAFVVVQALSAGTPEARRLLLRATVGELLLNTIGLSATCTVMCAALGLLTAWLVNRTDVPLRRVWAVAFVLPLGIPDFVVAFGWVSLDHSLHGFVPAAVIMTLSLYPLVYLPVATALAGSDGSLEEAARSLGLGPWATFRRVTLRQVRPALVGGCMLVTLALLAEYGAFEILQYRTFTVEIFAEFKLGFDAVGASVLSLVLVLLSVGVLAGEPLLAGRRPQTRSGKGARRPAARQRLGALTLPVLALAALLVLVALAVPVATLVYWTAHGGATTLPEYSLLDALGSTALFSACAAILATLLAAAVATLALRHPGRLSALLERITYLPLALPGLVIALGLVAFAVRYAPVIYQSPVLLVIAYSILFLPLAVVAVRASLAGAPARLEDVARSLGLGPTRAFLRVTLPAIVPGLAAAAAFVFISTATELTATLILRPTAVETLATRFWEYTTGFAYAQAAPYALVMVAISAVPAYLLSRRGAAMAERERA